MVWLYGGPANGDIPGQGFAPGGYPGWFTLAVPGSAGPYVELNGGGSIPKPTWSGLPLVGIGGCCAPAVPIPANAIHPLVSAANQCRVRISRSLTMNAVNFGAKVNLVSASESPFSASRRNDNSTGAATCA